MLEKYAERLGIGDSNALKKAKELLRLINLKQSTMNDTVKIILSIDCAANSCGNEFDHDQAIKLSSLKKKDYNRQKELFEKLLDISKELSLTEICAQLELNDAIKNCATRLLTEFKKKQVYTNDVHSQKFLSSMAIYQSCKLKKCKTLHIKPKLIHISKLSLKLWKQLEQEWNEWIHKFSPLSDCKKINCSSETNNSKQIGDHYVNEVAPIESDLQPYEEWRESVLKEANILIGRS